MECQRVCVRKRQISRRQQGCFRVLLRLDSHRCLTELVASRNLQARNHASHEAVLEDVLPQIAGERRQRNVLIRPNDVLIQVIASSGSELVAAQSAFQDKPDSFHIECVYDVASRCIVARPVRTSRFPQSATVDQVCVIRCVKRGACYVHVERITRCTHPILGFFDESSVSQNVCHVRPPLL